MSAADLGVLGEAGGPWLLTDCGPDVLDRIRLRAVTTGAAVRVLRGRRTATLPGLFAEYARCLDFPRYFGHNWAALEDCLSDLGWLPAPGYVIVLDGAEQLLVQEPADVLTALVELLDRVGRHWSVAIDQDEPWDRPAVPFHTVLVTATPARLQALDDRLGT